MGYPDFIIAGVPKAGTTSLYNYLSQHPQIYLPDHKEPHFFAYEGKSLNFQGPGDDWLNEAAVTTQAQYRDLFAEAPPTSVTGEASAMYLYEPRAAKLIQSRRPDVHLIVVLRDPVERAYSSYMHLRRDGREPIDSFRDALDAEDRRVEQGWAPLWHYQRMSLYADQVRRYWPFVEAGQMKVFLFDDLVSTPQQVLREIFRFLRVDDTFEPDIEVKYNPSGIAASQAVHDFLSRKHPVKEWLKPVLPAALRSKISRFFKRLNLRSKPRLSPNVRRMLVDRFRPDVEEVQNRLGRDLSAWLQVEAES